MTRSTEAPLTSLKHLRKVSGRVCIVLVCIYVKKNNVVRVRGEVCNDEILMITAVDIK